MESYLSSITKQFEYYKSLGDKTFEQLSFNALQKEFVQDSNSISIVVNHIVGNMLSRQTIFLTEDGEKTWRHGDLEFEEKYKSKEELIEAWNAG